LDVSDFSDGSVALTLELETKILVNKKGRLFWDLSGLSSPVQ